MYQPSLVLFAVSSFCSARMEFIFLLFGIEGTALVVYKEGHLEAALSWIIKD